MSNIEKAIQKFKKTSEKKEKQVATNEKLKIIDIDEDGTNNDEFSSSHQSVKRDIEYTKRDELITSALNKKKDHSDSVYSLDSNENKEHQVDDNSIKFVTSNKNDEEKTLIIAEEEAEASTKVINFNVHENIIAYYESIGKLTWEGPVMVYFRRLNMALSNARKKDNCKVIAITSPNQGDGKSLITLNMAITLCNNKSSKVIILDCDFRKSSINKTLGFEPDKGLADYLNDNASFKESSFYGIVPRLTIMPVGNRPKNSYELLASEKAKELIRFLKKKYDFVLIDTPPVLAFPDAHIVSALSDGVIFVLNAKKTKKNSIKQAVAALTDCKLLGCIMNRSEAIEKHNKYGYGYNYNYNA